MLNTIFPIKSYREYKTIYSENFITLSTSNQGIILNYIKIYFSIHNIQIYHIIIRIITNETNSTNDLRFFYQNLFNSLQISGHSHVDGIIDQQIKESKRELFEQLEFILILLKLFDTPLFEGIRIVHIGSGSDNIRAQYLGARSNLLNSQYLQLLDS